MRPFIPARFLALTTLVLPASPAFAEDSPSSVAVSGSAAIVSDYRFRGISLSENDPAVQATINIAHESGLYVGAWGSSLDMGELYGPTEIDLYAGWAGTIAPRTGLDVAITYYSYPAGDDSLGNADYFETIAKLNREIGPVKATLGAGYSWDQSALGGDHLYLFGDAAAPVTGTPLTLKGHFGRSKGAMAPGQGDYLDWSLGADLTFGALTLGVAYVDTDLGGARPVDAAALFSISAAF